MTIKYLVDLSREMHLELKDAISEARELIKEDNTEVVVYKCMLSIYNDVVQRERVFDIEKYENGEIKESKYENK